MKIARAVGGGIVGSALLSATSMFGCAAGSGSGAGGASSTSAGGAPSGSGSIASSSAGGVVTVGATASAVSSTSHSATSSSGGGGCTGILSGPCGACLESQCCPQLAVCGQSSNCILCVTGDPQGMSCSTDAAANALLDCSHVGCEAECFSTSTSSSSTSSSSSSGGTTACTSGNFTISITVPMPPTYLSAGYGGQESLLLFYGTGTPAHVYLYNVSDFVQGNLLITGDDSLYDQGPTLSLTKPYNGNAPWDLSKFPNSTTYQIYSGSDANLGIETWNLSGLGPTDSLTSARTDATSTPFAFARVGATVYERAQFSNTWSGIASLGSAGSSGWGGLAVVRSEAGVRDFFTQAKITGGASGIVEQRWPNSLPSAADPPAVVFPATDLVPVGVSNDGCQLYASRTTANGLEMVVLKR